jgi:prepilin-type N-terminal cleavage/methylation domain-containing protein
VWAFLSGSRYFIFLLFINLNLYGVLQMTHLNSQSRRSEGGFTLVELAIVMIIIGLLIGGILKGQELINNARVSSSVSQLKGLEAAVNTFRDKYSGMPGDMTSALATARIPNCTALPCFFASSTLNANGHIDAETVDPGAAQGNLSETTAAFFQLTRADMLAGNIDTTLTGWNEGLYPDFNLGGKIRIGYFTSGTLTGSLGTNTSAALSGHYFVAGMAAGTAANAGTMGASSAAAIDRKLDDGLPNSGSVRAGSAAAGTTSCVATGTPAYYNEAAGVTACGLLFRALQ